MGDLGVDFMGGAGGLELQLLIDLDLGEGNRFSWKMIKVPRLFWEPLGRGR